MYYSKLKSIANCSVPLGPLVGFSPGRIFVLKYPVQLCFLSLLLCSGEPPACSWHSPGRCLSRTWHSNLKMIYIHNYFSMYTVLICCDENSWHQTIHVTYLDLRSLSCSVTLFSPLMTLRMRAKAFSASRRELFAV